MLQSGEQPESMELPEEERLAYFSELDVELQIAAEAVVQSQKQLELMKQQLSKYQNLETELTEKNNEISSLQIQLRQARDLQASSNKAASEATNDVEKLRSKLELVERSNTEILAHIISLQIEVNLKDEELNTAREMASDLTHKVEKLQHEVKSNDRELNLEVEIAMLKSEIHRGRARAAAAEMANVSVMSSRAGLYRAVEELAMEAEAAKAKERILTLKLKDSISPEIFEEDSEKDSVISDALPLPVNEEAELLKEKLEAANAEIDALRYDVEEAVRGAEAAEIMKKKLESANTEIDALIRFDIEEAVRKAVAAERVKEDYEKDGVPVNEEAEILKEKLEAACAEIDLLRSKVEKAVRRSEAAKKAKEEIKEQVRRSIERREQRKMASSEGHPQQRLNGSSTTKFDKPPRVRAKSLELGLSGHKEKSNSGYPGYVPLYRYLNIKIKSIDMK